MGAVRDEFERELAEWRQRYAGQPRREMIQLFLLALEREELVSVGYRETAIIRRLQTMPLTDEIRELIRHALLWVWKDEEIHAIYIRGVILKLGSLRLRLQAMSRQMAGAIGGWSASVQQHARWSEAPLSRALTGVLTRLGALMGKVPRDVREHLRYGPFRNFCQFNVDAEETAELCWQRLIDLTPQLPEVTPELCQDFHRIRDDEQRHGRIFRILVDALDAHDRLVPGETAATLQQKIGQVGQYFLGHQQRAVNGPVQPLGQGGVVRVIHGTTAEEKLPLFRQLLDESRLAEQIDDQARHLGKTLAQMRIAIKPSFMLGYHRRDTSNVTDPVLVEELARFLSERGYSDVAVVEGANLYDQFYQHRTVRDVAAYFGFSSPFYRVVDLSEEQVPHTYGRGLAQSTVGRSWGHADFRISFGKMRSHAWNRHPRRYELDWNNCRCNRPEWPLISRSRETSHLRICVSFSRAATNVAAVW